MTLPLRGGHATPSELLAAKQAITDRRVELERVRAAATKWQAGLAGLLAIATGLSIPALGSTIKELLPPYGIALAIAALAATGLAVGAGIAALHASGGMPKVRGTLTPGIGPRDAVAALKHLQVAIRLSIAALVLAGVVCMLSWFSPRTADAVTYHQVQAGSRTLCGAVDAKSVPGQLLITSKDKTKTEVVALTAVSSWTKVDVCP